MFGAFVLLWQQIVDGDVGCQRVDVLELETLGLRSVIFGEVSIGRSGRNKLIHTRKHSAILIFKLEIGNINILFK